MPFQQDHSLSDAGTAENPISPNNCHICSLKNLLVYYGFPPETAGNCIQTILTTEAKRAANNKSEMPTFPNPDNPAEQELTTSFVLNCLSNPNGLKMGIEIYDRANSNNRILENIESPQPKPFLVCANADRETSANSNQNVQRTYIPETHTLATDAPGKGHDLDGDHAYLVVPVRGHAQQWKVLDPWKREPTPIDTKQLKINLRQTPTANQTQYWVITSPPDESCVKLYTPNAPAKTHASNSKNGPKKTVFARVADWFKTQWHKVINAFKAFGRWLKKPFSSKSSKPK